MKTSLHDLDTKLEKWLNFDGGFYIECGANDGICQSNTVFLETEKKWKGLLVEPSPNRYRRCATNRSANIVENYALVSPDYPQKTITGFWGNDDDFSSLIASTSEIKDYFDDIQKKEITERRQTHTLVEVPCTTLDFLCKKHNINNVDFFSLDVEGFEIEVMKGMTTINPKYILVETTTSEVRRKNINEFMTKRGYEFIDRLSCNDELYVYKY